MKRLLIVVMTFALTVFADDTKLGCCRGALGVAFNQFVFIPQRFNAARLDLDF